MQTFLAKPLSPWAYPGLILGFKKVQTCVNRVLPISWVSCQSLTHSRGCVVSQATSVERDVESVLKQLLQMFGGPGKLITKRQHKLLDYAACKARVDRNRDVTRHKPVRDCSKPSSQSFSSSLSKLISLVMLGCLEHLSDRSVYCIQKSGPRIFAR